MEGVHDLERVVQHWVVMSKLGALGFTLLSPIALNIEKLVQGLEVKVQLALFDLLRIHVQLLHGMLNIYFGMWTA